MMKHETEVVKFDDLNSVHKEKCIFRSNDTFVVHH